MTQFDELSRRDREARVIRLFERDRQARAMRRALEPFLEGIRGQKCLEVGGLEGGLSFSLRKSGGIWTSIEFSDAGARALRGILRSEDVHVMDEGRLPVADGSYDRVVLVNCLEAGQGDATLVAECHRILKPNGRLMVLTPHEKRRGLLHPVRGLFRGREHVDGRLIQGFSETELFSALKDGFDVHEVRDFRRFFSAATDLATRARVDGIRRRAGWRQVLIEDWDSPEAQQIENVYKWMAPIAGLARLLDLGLFFTKGYHLVAVAQRRIWRPRTTPVLKDGRSIADATLNTKIGTAAPF